MRYISLLALAVFIVVGALAFSSPVWAGKNKVEVCHIPADDPDNMHTITISENALDAHLAHGDLAGSCNELCATLCDDGDACTIDDVGDCEQNGCPVTPEPVDCDDGATWTTDTCDSTDGCINTSLCPCWNGGPGSYPGVVNLADLWAVLAPEDCSVKDECEDQVSPLGLLTSARCHDELNQPVGSVVRLITTVQDFVIPDILSVQSCLWQPFIVIEGGSTPGQSHITNLDADEVAICEAEHNFFTANIDFPGFTDTCGLPTPGVE